MTRQFIYNPKRDEVRDTCGETLALLMSFDLLVNYDFRLMQMDLNKCWKAGIRKVPVPG